MKHLIKHLFLILPVLIFIPLAACELLQSGLSSQMQKKLSDETGNISVNGSVWYYPGSADMDMSLAPKSELALNISRKAAVTRPDDPSKPNGLTGAFQVRYANAAGRQSVAELPFKGGHFNDDYSVFYLDTSPISNILNPGLNPTGKGLLELVISGFVNNEDGDQKGRPLPPFTATVDIEPLFPGRNIYFSTRTPNSGRSIEIPLNAPVSFIPTADFIITGGANYPRWLFDADFELGLSPDKRTILLTPKQELYDKEFNFSVNIMGIIPPLSSIAAECTFNVFITNSLIILDGIKDPVWDSPEAAYAADPVTDAYSGGYIQPGNEIAGFYLLSDLNDLYVAFEFASLSNFWENDRIAIMIDKEGASGDTTASLERVTSVPKLSSKMYIENGSAFIYFVHIPGASLGKGNSILRKAQDTFMNDTSGNPSRVRVSKYNWVNPNGPLFLEYRFSLGDLGLAAGDKIRVLGVLSNHWDSDDSIHCTDIVPGGTRENSREAIYDFNTGLEYILGEGPAYIPPDPEEIIPPSAPTYLIISEKGSNGVRLRWGTIFNADYYRLYRSEAIDGVYEERPGKWYGGSGADWDLEGAAVWHYKVAAFNLNGSGPMTASVRVDVSGDPISKYSIIAMNNGVLDDGFLDPLGAAFSGDSRPPGGNGGNYDIKRLYLTNDAGYFYIALDFGSSLPKGYDEDRITVMIDNTSKAGTAALNANSRPALNTTIQPSGSVDLIIAKRMDATGWAASPSAVIETNTPAGVWGQDEEWFRTPGVNVIKFKIPASEIGNPSVGTEIRVFASFSEGWKEGDVFVRGIIPMSAATGAVGGQTLAVNMNLALTHNWF